MFFKYYLFQIKTNIHALHVDVKEGQSEVIIRFDSAKAADEVCCRKEICLFVIMKFSFEAQTGDIQHDRLWVRFPVDSKIKYLISKFSRSGNEEKREVE